jgi:hypothetical protein
MKEGIYDIAEDEDWLKVEWYVLILFLAVCFITKEPGPGSSYISDLEWMLEDSLS